MVLSLETMCRCSYCRPSLEYCSRIPSAIPAMSNLFCITTNPVLITLDLTLTSGLSASPVLDLADVLFDSSFPPLSFKHHSPGRNITVTLHVVLFSSFCLPADQMSNLLCIVIHIIVPTLSLTFTSCLPSSIVLNLPDDWSLPSSPRPPS